jgi:hypothetical protein
MALNDFAGLPRIVEKFRVERLRRRSRERLTRTS